MVQFSQPTWQKVPLYKALNFSRIVHLLGGVLHLLEDKIYVLGWQDRLRKESEVLQMPQLACSGQLCAEVLYKYYWFAENLQYYRQLRLWTITLSEPRQKVLWGGYFATLRLDFTYDDYFHRVIKSPERALIRKAMKNGYSVRAIDYDDYIEQIKEINVSKGLRGGRTMGKDYVEVRKRDCIVKPYNPEIFTFGCFSGTGELVAYYMFERFTNFYHTVKGIGHSEHLNMGIMNYLFAYSVAALAEKDNDMVLVYGMMGNDGLSRFKKNVGCQPKRIIYSGTRKVFDNLDYFMENYSLHDDSALNYVHEYILTD